MRKKESTKNLEDRIQELEEELQLLKTGLNALPFGLALQDRNKDLVFANQYFQNIQDEQADPDTELIGKEEASDNLEETFLGRFIEVHFRIGRESEKEGTTDYRDYLEQNIPVKEGSEVRLALKLVEDISMRLKSEAVLQNSEVEHRTLVENAPTIIYRYSSRKGATFWSQKVKDVLGFDVHELYRNPFIWNQAIHPEDREKVNTLLENAQMGRTYVLEYRIKARSGEWKWLADYFLIEQEESGDKVFLGYAIDITPRKQLEERLIYTESQMDLALRSSGIGVWDWDLITNAIYYSPTWKSMLGYEVDEIKHDYPTWKNLVHPDDIQNAENDIQKYLAGKTKVFQTEFRMKHKSGKWIDILSKGSALFDKKGQPYRFIGSHQDMTQRNKSQLQIVESERLWKYALEGTEDGVWDWNIKTNEVYFSSSWKQMLGFEEDQISGNVEEWESRVHPEDLEKVYTEINKHLNKETNNYLSVHRVLHQKGHYIWTLDRGKIMEYDEDGSPLRMIGTHTDISDQVNTQKELEASKLKFQTIFDIIHVGITITDEEGNIIDCNKESETLLGISREEHLRRNYSDKEWWLVDRSGKRLDPEDYPAAYALREKKAVNNKEIGVYNKGELKWLSISARPLNIKGYGALLAYVDITELIDSQAQLKDANHTKDKFFSIIAHDLKGPFNTLLNLSQLGLNDLSERRYDMLEEIMSLMRDASKQAYELLNNLLNWSRLQVGTISYHETDCHLNTIYDDVISVLDPTLQNKQIKIANKLRQAYRLKADKDMLETVFRNLLANAIKYTPRQGKISMGARKKGSKLECYVKDNGVGIPAAVKKHLFDSQKTVSTLGTDSESGTGLGLVIVQEFVNMHQGNIKVESEEDKGTTFTIELPS